MTNDFIKAFNDFNNILGDSIVDYDDYRGVISIKNDVVIFNNLLDLKNYDLIIDTYEKDNILNCINLYLTDEANNYILGVE